MFVANDPGCCIVEAQPRGAWLYTVCMVRGDYTGTWVDLPCTQEVTMTVLPLLRKRGEQRNERHLIEIRCRLEQTCHGHREQISSEAWGGLQNSNLSTESTAFSPAVKQKSLLLAEFSPQRAIFLTKKAKNHRKDVHHSLNAAIPQQSDQKIWKRTGTRIHFTRWGPPLGRWGAVLPAILSCRRTWGMGRAGGRADRGTDGRTDTATSDAENIDVRHPPTRCRTHSPDQTRTPGNRSTSTRRRAAR